MNKIRNLIRMFVLISLWGASPVLAVQSPSKTSTKSIPDGIQFDPNPPAPPRSFPKSISTQSVIPFERFSLDGQPTDEQQVATSLETILNSNPKKLGVEPGYSFRLERSQLIPGEFGVSPVVYTHFVQVWNNLDVVGSRLSFTTVISKDASTVVKRTKVLFQLNRKDSFSKARLNQGGDLLKNRLSKSTRVPTVNFLRTCLRYLGGRWLVVDEYKLSGSRGIGAVDEDGTTYLWDNVVYETYTGNISGWVKAGDPQDPNLTKESLPSILVSASPSGKPAEEVSTNADSKGNYELSGDFSASPTISSVLTGPAVRVVSETSPNLIPSATAIGPKIDLVFNDGAQPDIETSQPTAYHHFNLIYNWAKENNLVPTKDMEDQLLATVNGEGSCNAYYQPGTNSFEFFAADSQCRNAAYDTVVYHEFGHFLDDINGGIAPDDGLSEGWGDLIATYFTRQPLIGEHFFQNGRSLRSASNTYHYNPYNDVHDSGQAWAGFAWDMRSMLMSEFGEQEGEMRAKNLIFPMMASDVSNIPEAVTEVFERDRNYDPNGSGPNSAKILKAASNHGIPILTATPSFTFPFPLTPVLGTATLLKPGNSIDIRGTGNVFEFQSYVMEWAPGILPSSGWKSSSISLANNGTVGIINGILGTWHIDPQSPKGFYSLRLTVYSASGDAQSVTTVVYLESELKSGNWPVYISDAWGGAEGWGMQPDSASIVPLDKGTNSRLIYTGPTGQFTEQKIREIDATGNVTVKVGPETPNWTGPTVGQIDGQPGQEIVMGRTDDANYFRQDGSSVHLVRDNNEDLSTSFMIIDDLNRDGKNEIISARLPQFENDPSSKALYVWNSDGTKYSPNYSVPVNPFCPPFVFDTDRDGKKEIILIESKGGDDEKLLISQYSDRGELIESNDLKIFPKRLTSWSLYAFDHDAVAGDLDGDGELDIALYYLDRNDSKAKVALFSPDGVLKYGNWPVTVGPVGFGHLAIADTNRDGKDEIVVVGESFIDVLNMDGTHQTPWPIADMAMTNGRFIVGDIDGDHVPEILVANNHGMSVPDAPLFSYNIKTIDVYNSQAKKMKSWFVTGDLSNGSTNLVLDDLDHDGSTKLYASYERELQWDHGDALIVAYNFKSRFNADDMDWPMVRHDPQGTAIKLPPYAISVSGGVILPEGTSQGSVRSGSQVTVSANKPDDENLVFDHWESDPLFVAAVNSRSQTMTFVMPTTRVQVTAKYRFKPIVSIVAPRSGSTFKVGDTINFSGTAMVQGVKLPSSHFSWTVTCLDEAGVSLPEKTLRFVGISQGSFLVPANLPDAAARYRFELTVTDTGEDYAASPVEVSLEKSMVQLLTDPAGLNLIVNGTLLTAPSSKKMLVGARKILEAPDRQTAGDLIYTFDRWSDGGPRNHEIEIPDQAALSLTAVYKRHIPTNHVTVISGSGNGDFMSGASVSIVADPPSLGMKFDRWVGNAQFVNEQSVSTTFLMPTNDVTVTAMYRPVESSQLIDAPDGKFGKFINVSPGSMDITFGSVSSVHAKVAIYNMEGLLIRHLFDGTTTPPSNTVTWDEKNEDGNEVASNIYLAILDLAGRTDVKKLAILR